MLSTDVAISRMADINKKTSVSLLVSETLVSWGQPTSSSLPVGEKWSGEVPLISWCSAPHDNWGHKELFKIVSAAFGRDMS